ncbi:MAG: Crp/Fnr family transcriptional regulator [Bacteroidota bacterium]
METRSCTLPNGRHTCVNCVKKVHSLFDGLSPDELALLDSHRNVVGYRKDEVIYKEGTKPMGLLCLNTGKVKLTRRGKNGSEQIVGLKRPVDFIDVRSVIGDWSYSHSAVALENSSVCFIDRNDFLSVVQANPKLSLKIIRMFASELDDADRRFIDLTQLLLRERLAATLLYLRSFYGTQSDGKTLNCTIKRADLAGLSNMNVANVIRTISAFEKEGIVVSEKKKIVILNEKALHDLAASKTN